MMPAQNVVERDGLVHGAVDELLQRHVEQELAQQRAAGHADQVGDHGQQRQRDHQPDRARQHQHVSIQSTPVAFSASTSSFSFIDRRSRPRTRCRCGQRR
jgi:uncharacterized protein YdaU (DUF1376 family)